ncbi:hypothetical protein O3G_MSEX013488 [Manduca sexta]|uniref:WD repeat-containing protein 74 n=1 Tax=Manduca sexta TaxID=7130 RepID=A0A921ZR72_MANSE|nr:hypothetical protein O3G_MSEX013488 [Manduca sexta]
MLLTEDTEIDLFVASKIGSFKHIKYHTESSKNTKKCIENLVDIKSLQKDDCVTCMEWGNKDQTEILIGKKNQEIQVYSTLQGFTKTYTADYSEGQVVGLGRCGRRLLSATAGGVVRVWGKDVDIHTGGKLDRMRVCDDDTLFATGGEENDLKIWRLGEAEPVFQAKNLPHDWLQLRRPIWVTDLTFLPGEGGRLAAVCSRHGYVRLYDSRAQRRPVHNVEFQLAATCIAPSFDERQVLVGFGRGQIHQVDLRVGRPDKGYKGCVGSVTCLAAVKQQRLIVSASLDRHIRVHRYETKELLYKQYLTSKLTCVLAQTESSTPLSKQPDEVKDEPVEAETAQDPPDDMDQLFDNMETVGDKPKKIKKEMEESVQLKKMKPSTEGSTVVDLTEEEREDAIKQLLRSTEKQKKKREKKKRQKKAKSVFHNA